MTSTTTINVDACALESLALDLLRVRGTDLEAALKERIELLPLWAQIAFRIILIRMACQAHHDGVSARGLPDVYGFGRSS